MVRTGGRTDVWSYEYQNLSDGSVTNFFLAMGLRLRSLRARVELWFDLPSDPRHILASFILAAYPIFSFPLSELHFRVASLTSTEFWFVQQRSNRGIWNLVSFTVVQSSFYYLLVTCVVWYYALETFIRQEHMIFSLTCNFLWKRQVPKRIRRHNWQS